MLEMQRIGAVAQSEHVAYSIPDPVDTDNPFNPPVKL